MMNERQKSQLMKKNRGRVTALRMENFRNDIQQLRREMEQRFNEIKENKEKRMKAIMKLIDEMEETKGQINLATLINFVKNEKNAQEAH